jgi:sec-independent protein translocase protein TatC
MSGIDNEKKMGILGHLAELRSRLLKGVIAVIITSILAFIFADRIFQVLVLPLNGVPLIYIDMTEMVGVYMKVCMAGGIFCAMPYLVYQVLMFLSPALTPREKKYIYFILPWIFLMFVGGIAFSYFVLIPPAVQFLTSFGNNIATPQIRIGSYITVVTRVLLATGISFELPVITTFLARLGVITPGWLASKRKLAVILALIIGAIITPTPDPINQLLVAGPLYILYEMSIWLAKLVQRRQLKTVISEPTPIS